MSYRVNRVAPIEEPTFDGAQWQYADGFEILLDEPDEHVAEQWLRAAVGQLRGPLRALVPAVHRAVVRLDLDPADPDDLLGWHQTVAEPDVAAIEADGSLVRAVLVARRHSPTRLTGSTYLFFHKARPAQLMWLFVRPIHVQVERQLLAGAARTLTRGPIESGSATARSS